MKKSVFLRFLIFTFFIQTKLFAFDFPGAFGMNLHGDLAPVGLSGFYSTPARVAEPGFGVSVSRLPSTNQSVVGVAGEFGNSFYRLSAFGSYGLMDSIYRQVYNEWDASINFDWLILGAGYGLSVEWIPGDATWTRHRYKGASTLKFKDAYLSTMVWNYTSESFERLEFLLGFYVNPSESFSAFAQWNGSEAFVGTSLNFKYFSLSTAYRLPGFSVAFSLEFRLQNWTLEGAAGKSNQSLEWFNASIKNKIQKKTIL